MITVSTTRPRYMTQADHMSWRMEEDPILRSTIVAVALLDRSPDWQRFVDMMDRGTRRVPIFRQRVVTDAVGPAPPRWVNDPEFDLSWHLRRLAVPEGGGWSDVLDFARTAAMAAFDKERPLWEFTVLSGLDSGQAAIVMKVHHALTDGIGGMQIVNEIVDFSREGTVRDDPPAAPASTDSESTSPIGGLAWYQETAGRLTWQAATTLVRRTPQLVLNPLAALRSAVSTLGSTIRFTRPVVTTNSPVMTKRSTRRRLAVLDVPIKALGHAASAGGGSINDAFLASILLGTARYHRLHDVDVARLRVTMPISLRTEGDPLGGNRVTLARFELPADISDPAELVRSIHGTVDTWRHEPAAAITPTIAGALNMLPSAVLGSMFKHVDFLASDVVGSPIPLFIAGSEVLGYYAFGPTLGSAFNVTLISFMSRCCIGINVDAESVPDIDLLAESLARGFRDVLALCPDADDVGVVVTT
ncbi:wax ester/triacylglycerol synthase domain-containing protein [Rhodococcus chondri]|uniref:diacylglycerol O-acyltransferase n=1 Tax=Rhodococcus chondri TaxID=3065941 RepID=A0ABU7JRS2_9NOCA|nr:wax ester/triacylglycerol synthase domain-containing protein [Rhodococcus sp. CC-R104]MEE2032733.1 wax ester/triacylglycerol synthase family O-acyltransferase [Rhodococcus sp. CC-R104]